MIFNMNKRAENILKNIFIFWGFAPFLNTSTEKLCFDTTISSPAFRSAVMLHPVIDVGTGEPLGSSLWTNETAA